MPPPPAMEFAFILDPLASLKAYKDTSVAMMRALQDRGHALFALEQRDLFWDGKQTLGTGRLLTVAADDHDWFQGGTPAMRPLQSFAAVLMRKNPPLGMGRLYSACLVEPASAHGATLFHPPRAL